MKKEATLRDGVNAFSGFPVVLVTTRDNIITVALVHRFSYNPFMLGIGISHRRYSYQLIETEREFIVNIPTSEHLEQVKLCGRLSGRDTDKFHEAGFTKMAGKKVESSMIAECPVSIECKVVQEIKLEERTWFIGEVVAVHAEDGYDASESLLCDRRAYMLIGESIGQR
ncbi:flavin reductase family protein [Candidatus Poribacteria bacterium]